MSAFTDPTGAYVLLILGAIVAAIGAGWFLGQQMVGILAAVIIIGIIGFMSGTHIRSSDGEWVGFLILTGGIAAIIAYILPPTMLQGLAIFIIGYVIGMRSPRRH